MDADEAAPKLKVGLGGAVTAADVAGAGEGADGIAVDVPLGFDGVAVAGLPKLNPEIVGAAAAAEVP